MLLLDAGGAFLLIPFFIAFHFLLTALIEGGVLRIFKYNTFGRCIRDAFVANFLSLLGGFALFAFAVFINDTISAYTDLGSHFLFSDFLPFTFLLLLTFIVTVIIETKYWQSKNQNLPYKTLLTASLIGNGLTYLLLIGFFKMI